jgi:DNA-binding CsgD family transcriptional regulator
LILAEIAGPNGPQGGGAPMRSCESAGLSSWLSAGEAVKLLELTRACISCRTEREFRSLFPRIQEVLPFDHAIAMSGRRNGQGGVIVDRAVNVSFPEEYAREYVSRDYFRVDHVMWNALATGRAQYCSEGTRERPREVIELGKDFGVQDGYVLGSRALAPAEGEGSLFSFKSRSMRHDGRAAAVLELVTPHLELAFSRVAGGEEARAGPVSLSAREKEVVSWLKEGKSSWEISVILRISERTVNFHVYNVLRKLGAINRPQAVAIAARLGLVD